MTGFFYLLWDLQRITYLLLICASCSYTLAYIRGYLIHPPHIPISHPLNPNLNLLLIYADCLINPIHLTYFLLIYAGVGTIISRTPSHVCV